MIILIMYLILLLVAFLYQRELMYFPEHLSAEQFQQRIKQAHLQAWPSVENFQGLIKVNSAKLTKGTVLVFHGNAGSAINRSHYFAALQTLGYRVILVEYPGYAGRPGDISEKTLVDDGIKAVAAALKQFDEPLFLWGESLGSGVVSGIIQAKQFPIRGVVLLTPFDSMARVAQTHYWYLFAGLMVKDTFNNVENLNEFSGNVAVLLCEQDEIIPKKHSLRLFDALNTHKKLWTFENSGHNSWPSSPSELWWKEVMRFVEQQDVIAD